MSEEEYYNKIIRLKEQRPFQPFAIDTKDGGHYEVTDWLHLALTPRNPVMILFDPKQGGCRIRKDQIAAIRVIESVN
jgi:hypothetical protein